jgi:hypothetical protein
MEKGKAIMASGLILLCLLASRAVQLQPVRAQYQGDITMNLDGSITPMAAPIMQSGNTYSLTSDINGSITIVKSGIILDGNSHTVSLPTSLASFASVISLVNVSNVTLKNLIIINGQFGINVEEQ